MHKVQVDYDGENMQINGLEHKKALIHFYFKIDPDGIPLEEVARLWSRLEFALEFEGKLKMNPVITG